MAWRQQAVTVVTDLKANPEPFKLFNSLKIRMSNLTSSDNAFATQFSQMHRSTEIKTNCTDKALLHFMGLLEIEMSKRAREDDADSIRRGQANAAASSSSPPKTANAAAAATAANTRGRKGKGRHKDGGKERRGLYVRTASQTKELNYVTSASACSFYTTFALEDHPENLPILDTGATHCLLPFT